MPAASSIIARISGGFMLSTLVILPCMMRKCGLFTFSWTDRNRSLTRLFWTLLPLIRYLFFPPMTTYKDQWWTSWLNFQSTPGMIICCVVYLDPVGSETCSRIRIRIEQERKSRLIKIQFLDCSTVIWNRKWQIVGRFFFLIDYKVFSNNFLIWLNNMGRIRIS